MNNNPVLYKLFLKISGYQELYVNVECDILNIEMINRIIIDNRQIDFLLNNLNT